MQVKLGELRECCDVGRDGASEFVVVEHERLECRRERFEHPQRLGERRPWERGTCEKSPIRFRRVAWALRSGIESRTREGIVLEPECLQVRQAADRLGNCACTS